MRLRHLASLAFVALSWISATAQDGYYDLTEHYLTNSLFDGNYDYDSSQTGNVAQQMLPVNGWTNDYTVDYTIVGVYQVGTKKTYNNAKVPATNADGTTDGGVLALSTGWGVELKLYQGVYLPAGKYKIVTAYYNGDASKTAGESLTGWIPQSGTNAMSKVSSFTSGQWIKDEISFTLTKPTMGKVQVGFKAAGGGSGNSAKIAVDYVRLLRDTPYGDADQELCDNPVGPVPTVTTDSRFVRGATMAFGRMTVSDGGAVIKERGFCYGESPEPTIADSRCTTTLNSNGPMYWLKDLKPATMYYMRAYAITAGNQVGYGDVIKFCTVPKGNVTYWYNNGGDNDTNARIKAALDDACYYFNNMGSAVRKFNVGYSAGTPTADCNYQSEPWMNVGPNASYQRTGTIMHEMEHGLGLQNYSTQWCKGNLRSGNGTGTWTGDRVTEALHFWDNNTTTVLNGDNIHMWPYGINGANEDNGTEQLYLANAMLCQALGEDGLEHNETRFAEPYYSFNQEDDVKFYIKNEAESRGRYTSFLMPNKSGLLKWVDMTSAEAAANDSTAWYITFTPANQYYQLRNAATGQYLTYNGSSIKTATLLSPSTNENWHLMRGRIDVDGQRGYWIVHPTSNWTPPCLQAYANGATASATFNIANTAETQRWLFLTAEEMKTMETKAVEQQKKAVDDMIARVRTMAETPHTEDFYGADAMLQAALDDIEGRKEASVSTVELSALAAKAKTAGFEFLKSVTPADASKPFDLTWLLVNPTVDKTIDGWTATAITALDFGCVEYYQKEFDFNQMVAGLPAGNYEFAVQAFQRPGKAEECSGNSVTTSVYAGGASQMVAHAVSDAQTTKLGGNESEVNGKYIPNNMEAASKYFSKGLYQNRVEIKLPTDDGNLEVGLRCTSSSGYYWTIFDNFRLYYKGNVGVNPGDANHDGLLDGSDVESVINHLLGNTPNGFSLKAADLNRNGVVDILDVTTLIKIIINQ